MPDPKTPDSEALDLANTDFETGEGKFIAKQVIRVEMTKLNIGYRELAAALGDLGVVEEEKNLRNKIARGTFSAAFLITCLAAMKVKKIDLEPWFRTMDEVLTDIRAILAEDEAQEAERKARLK